MIGTKKASFAVAALGCAVIATGLTACNSNSVNFLKGLSLSIVQQGTDQYFKLTSTIDMGQVSLAAMTVGIIDPSTQQQQGEVDFSENADGTSTISLLANTNLLLKGTAANGMVLPNGKPIPSVLGAASGDVLGIQVLDHSTLYMGGSTASTAYVGMALGIAGFDDVIDHLSASVNVFFMGNFTNNILGVGGIYTSTTANESGVAIFGKYTATTTASAKALSKSLTATPSQDSNEYAIERLNSYNANKLAKFFYHGKKRKMRVN